MPPMRQSTMQMLMLMNSFGLSGVQSDENAARGNVFLMVASSMIDRSSRTKPNLYRHRFNRGNRPHIVRRRENDACRGYLRAVLPGNGVGRYTSRVSEHLERPSTPIKIVIGGFWALFFAVFAPAPGLHLGHDIDIDPPALPVPPLPAPMVPGRPDRRPPGRAPTG